MPTHGDSSSPSSDAEEEGGTAAAGWRSRFSRLGRRSNSRSEPSASSEKEDRSDHEGEDSDYQPEPEKLEKSGPMSGTRRSWRLKTSASTMTSVKPLNSKPACGSKASSPVSASVRKEKRPAGDDLMAGGSEKKNKKYYVVVEVEDASADDEKSGEKRGSRAEKQSAKRVWEEEDEIELLRSLEEYTRKRMGALNDMKAFFEFSKQKMGKFVKRQVESKVCKLKKKYQINAAVERKTGKAAFKTQHEQNIFLMSKDIWGNKENSVKSRDDKEKHKNPASPRKSERRFSRNSSVAKKLEFHDGRANALQNEGTSSGQRHAVTAVSVSEDEIHVEMSNKSDEAAVSWREELGSRFFTTDELIEKGLRLADKLKVKGFEEKRRNLEDMMLDVHLTVLELACKKTQLALEGFKAAKSGVVNQ